MSGYENFSRCVICRSKKNLNDYNGLFEVTALLNTLYLAVMYPIERRAEIHVSGKKLGDFLRKNNIVYTCGNEFTQDDLIRYLRNGLAHFNVEVTPSKKENNIDRIEIYAKNLAPTRWCIESCTCTCSKRFPRSYNESNGKICIFTFSVEKLKEFTNYVITSALEAIPDSVCNSCPYRKD